MALNPLQFERLLQNLHPGHAIASMGYPDILHSELRELVTEILGDVPIKYRDDSASICKRHGKQFRQIPDAEALFEMFGCSLDVYDIKEDRGGEIVLDLNHPFPANACEQYEHVLDVGTLEHCFNVAQAAINMAAIAKVGGRVYHDNPFNNGNHGFYGLNPTWYHDFYGANGFEVEDCRLITQDGFVGEQIGCRRFFLTEKEANCIATVVRREVRPFVFPTQAKYRPKDKRGESSGSDRQ